MSTTSKEKQLQLESIACELFSGRHEVDVRMELIDAGMGPSEARELVEEAADELDDNDEFYDVVEIKHSLRKIFDELQFGDQDWTELDLEKIDVAHLRSLPDELRTSARGKTGLGGLLIAVGAFFTMGSYFMAGPGAFYTASTGVMLLGTIFLFLGISSRSRIRKMKEMVERLSQHQNSLLSD